MVASPSQTESQLRCAHCGDACAHDLIRSEDKVFCCEGCQAVYHLLAENELCNYYELNQLPGNSLKSKKMGERFAFLDEPSIAQGLYDYYSEHNASLTLTLPGIHCSSCIWLLENLAKLREGVLVSRVNFLRKEIFLQIDPELISLRQVVELLSTLGYEPQLSLASSSAPTRSASSDLVMRIGVTGFCLGNVMLLSFPAYFDLDLNLEPYGHIFLAVNLLLSLPVVFYGAWPYFRSAWASMRQGVLNLDFPISLGIITLYLRSLVEVAYGWGPGYFDSLTGLVFLLLLGRYAQQRTYESLHFQRDYRSFFPLSSLRKEGELYRSVPVTDLQAGERIRVNHQELIPCDSQLLSPEAYIDYSFLSGESLPVKVLGGESVRAGGRMAGPSAELLVEKPVKQSYLTELWNKPEFAKPKETPGTQLDALFARYFTLFTISLAVLAACYWGLQNQAGLALNAFTAVLIIACPCALSLSMPFAMGAAMAVLGRNRFYVKNPVVIQHLAEIDHVVFDKTGTLTAAQDLELDFIGCELSPSQERWIYALAFHSTHPLCRSVVRKLENRRSGLPLPDVVVWEEIPGRGIRAESKAGILRLGSAEFVGAPGQESGLHVRLAEQYLGYFRPRQALRQGLAPALDQVALQYRVSVVTGDKAQGLDVLEDLRLQTREKLQELRHSQSPQQKMDFIKELKARGQKVLMVGDGLNDAGALQAATLGLALMEDANAFTPSSDIIAEGRELFRLPIFMRFARLAVLSVKISFLLSVVYNVIGLSWALSGTLNPLFAAIFMPASSLTVVLLGVGLTSAFARKLNL